MKTKYLGFLAALFVASAIVNPTIAVVQAVILDDVEAQLANPLVELKTTSVTCATTATQIKPDPIGASMMIINTSATAVFIGGSDVDGSTAGTTGVAIGDGATAGKTLSVDSREAFCVVGSGTVVVEVLYGVR